MRAFFGLSPNAETRLEIEAWRRKVFPSFNQPVSAANFHVTLAFLGQLSSKQYESITEHVDTMSKVDEFDVTLNQLGYWSKPKALWLGSKHPANEHVSLSASLYKIANSIGLHLPKKKYVAHLTLVRKCSVNPPAPLIEPNFKWRANEFHLFESVSGPKGVSYHSRQSWPLEKRFAFS